MVPVGVRKRLWLGMGVAAVAAATVATGAFGVSGSDTITTIAGTGQHGFSGDGGPAAAAQLSLPTGVAVDGQGNVYIADRLNSRVRKVSAGWRITTIAGTGKPGFSGDGGPATSARLSNPSGVAADGRGNVYIAEIHRVRRVSASGRITTFAGTGKPGFSGDGGPATSAQLWGAEGVAVDGQGNVYIADAESHSTENNRVRKVSPDGTITTFAGTGKQGSSGDGGPATSARLSFPTGLAVDGQGNVYIADSYNNRVRKVDPSGTITAFAGTGRPGYSGDGGPATSARLGGPAEGNLQGLAADGQGNVYIADRYRVRKVSPRGTISTFAGTGKPGAFGDGGPANSAQLGFASGVAVDAKGDVYIADKGSSRVRKVGVVSVRALGRCSRAAALQVVERLSLGEAGFTTRPVAQVLCGAFVGPRSRAMVVSLSIPSCGRSAGWVVFRWAEGTWQLVLTRNNGADLTAVGSDIREQQNVLKPTDAHCFPTGGTRARTWHWNGARFTVSAWKHSQ